MVDRDDRNGEKSDEETTQIREKTRKKEIALDRRNGISIIPCFAGRGCERERLPTVAGMGAKGRRTRTRGYSSVGRAPPF